MTKHLTAAVLLLVSANSARAGQRWYEHSLHLYMGQVNNAATIYGRGNYGKLDLGNELERGIAYTLLLDRNWELDLALSHLHSSGTQRGRPGSGDESDRLYVDLQLNSVYITGKRRCERMAGLFVPWAGFGLNADLLETEETESVATAGGTIRKPRKTRSSSGVGMHLTAGIDIYPRKSSALALVIQTRYDLTLLERGPFDGETGGPALLFALRWDFFPSAP